MGCRLRCITYVVALKLRVMPMTPPANVSSNAGKYTRDTQLDSVGSVHLLTRKAASKGSTPGTSDAEWCLAPAANPFYAGAGQVGIPGAATWHTSVRCIFLPVTESWSVTLQCFAFDKL